MILPPLLHLTFERICLIVLKLKPLFCSVNFAQKPKTDFLEKLKLQRFIYLELLKENDFYKVEH